jgi:peptidoglycan biosynthesis protein MviN/MurJ (putative lipid II flippase)
MSLLRRVWQHLVNPDSSHGQIAKGFLWVSLFVLVGKLAGAAKEMTIAWRYGVSIEVDAYLYVLNLINWPISVWLSVLTAVLVPLAARLQAESPQAFPRFRAELTGMTLIGAALLLGAAWFGLPAILESSWAGLSDATRSLALGMVPDLLWLLPIGILSGLYAAWMLAGARHANTLLESVPALVILAFLLLYRAPGLAPLIWGSLAGGTLHLLLLLLLSGRRKEMDLPRFDRGSPHWPAFLQGFWLALAGQSVMALTALVDQFFAAQLAGGAVATLSYANRVLGLILTLGATAVARATMPVLAAGYLRDASATRVVVRHWVRLTFGVGALAVAAGWPLANWVIGVLFERGQFLPQDTRSVTEVFRLGLLQLPFYAAGLVYASWLTSQRHYLLLLAIAVCNLGVKIGAATLLVNWMGVPGLMLSNALMLAVALPLFFVASQFAERSKP